jgi:hypothetical protein
VAAGGAGQLSYDFPNSPTVGQTFSSGGALYVWDGMAWRVSGQNGPAMIRIADEPPPTGTHGNLWWDSNDAALYIRYDDGSSIQWVQISGVHVVTGPTGPIGISGEGYLRWALSDETTPIVVGNAKVTDRMPKAYTVSGIRASLNVAQASGALFTVDMKWWNGSAFVSALSTLITFDNTETTSVSAAAQPVLSKTSFVSDDLIRFDVTQVGSGSATGLKVTLFAVPT